MKTALKFSIFCYLKPILIAKLPKKLLLYKIKAQLSWQGTNNWYIPDAVSEEKEIFFNLKKMLKIPAVCLRRRPFDYTFQFKIHVC